MGLDDDGSVLTGAGDQPEVTGTEIDTGAPYSLKEIKQMNL